MNTPWNDHDTAELKRLWEVEGKSASQISKILGRTRNAIIGKANRENFAARIPLERKSGPRNSGPRQPRPSRAKRPRLRNSPIFKLIRSPSLPTRSQPAPPTILKPILELEGYDCRWPTGEGSPGETTYGFCGLKQFGRSPYCESHTRIAYTPVPKRREIVPTPRVRPAT